ncbi:MAG: hypothetical protein GY795_40690 [Desulfobacterales bacterium]|nr:hypothetical protein [Desulfobacterales bacterium]
MCYLIEMDKKVPGGTYLCQVNDQVSCGACCGLFNVSDVSQSVLTSMLMRRTEAFAKVPRNMDSILEFKEEIEAREIQVRPFPDFHHCPYIGLTGPNRSCVGCLLHPLASGNNGIDFRGLSYYGGVACRVYFCPTYHSLPKSYKEIIRKIATDWYLYGMVITEVNMLNAFFQETEKRLGYEITKEDFSWNGKSADIVREFLSLKIDWPFRASNTILCNYFFGDKLYPKPLFNYKAIGSSVSKYDVILQELVSSFDSAEELHWAENILDQLFDRMIRSFEAP